MATKEEIAGYTDVVTGSSLPPVDGGAAQIQSVSAPELKSLLGLVVGVVVIAALYFGRDVLIPITLALMLSFVLSPIVDLLQRIRLPRGAAVLATVVVALGILGLVATLIGTQAAALSTHAPQYAKTIEAKAQNLQGFATDRLSGITRELGLGDAAGPRASTPAGRPAPSLTTSSAAQPRAVPVRVVSDGASPLTIARSIVEPVLGPLETLVIVLIVAVFVLMQREDLRDRFIRIFGSSDLHRTTLAIDDAGQRLSRYFLSQLAVNTSFGVVIGLGLWIIGIPSPAMWGILAGLLRFVPYVGSFLAAIVPIALGAAIEPGWGAAIEVALLFVVVEPLTGYVVEPLLYGHSTGLSPVSVIVAAIFWTWLWGPIGLIMSTPLTLCLVVLGRHVKSLEFFDVLLGDRPALTSVESFYQRILANDPDEALAQAEELLQERSLIAYYDEVALAGLRLAAEDEAKGTLNRAREGDMARAMLELIGDLEPDARPSADVPAIDAGPVACIAGRGPFDDAVSAMLAQVLGQRSVAARVIAHDAVGRDTIARLDLSDVETIALSYLEISGSPAHLRYLIRRLRKQAPAAHIIVGLWPEGEAVLSDAAIGRAVGADDYVGTLSGAVDAIARGATQVDAAA